MRVSKDEFLQQLRAVESGLSKGEGLIEQSSCFAFLKGKVMTFNDEMACQTRSGLDKSFTGAVKAAPLLRLLDKVQDDFIELDTEEGFFLIRGKRKKAKIMMEREVTLPISAVDTPEEWISLPSRFREAVETVQECAGRDESKFTTTCIHIHPKWIEATDRLQLSRYRIKIGVSKPCLVRKDSLSKVITFDVTEFSETEKWIHFRNPANLILSCSRYLDQFRDLTPFLETEGTIPATLPPTIGEAAERAEIFSSENQDSNFVEVRLKPGNIYIKGQGASGEYAEGKSLAYEGPTMTFIIKPKVLGQLVRRHSECLVAKDRLVVKGDRFVYITCLGVDNESVHVNGSEVNGEV